MRLSGLLSLIFLVCGSCVEPLEVPIIKSERYVVVNGMITNNPGPYVVKLSWSLNLSEKPEDALPVQGAIVSISDDQGNSETLLEGEGGAYSTTTLQGVLGRKYKLTIITSDGVSYESIPATLQPAGEITNLYFEYKKNAINADNPLLPQDAIAIYIDGKGEDGFPNLFRWRWLSSFHIRTFPERRSRVEWINGIMNVIPDPEPCSGVIYDVVLGYVVTGPCTCCDCWITQKGTNVLISNNTVVNNNFNRVLLTMVPVDEWLFDERYYVVAEQVSIQPEVYNFWKLVSVQQKTTENIFQPNTVFVQGNMRSTSHPGKKIHGIFSVSAIVQKSFNIYPTDIPGGAPAHELGVTDCADFFENSSYEEPVFW